MSGIAGIASAKRRPDVERMLDAIKHRGPAGKAVMETESATMGVVWPASQAGAEKQLMENQTAADSHGTTHVAEAKIKEGSIAVSRDRFGAAPLYYGWTDDNVFCFASEVKALRQVSQQVFEVPPGVIEDIQPFSPPSPDTKEPFTDDPPEKVATEIFSRINKAVKGCLADGVAGSWLSGGLDSSVLCATVRPYVKTLHTFSVGMADSTDLDYARRVADALETEHHEIIVNREVLAEVMPEAVACLESFDARLIRSSMMNYIVGKLASDYVPEIFSGEAGDELFAGYDYLADINPSELPGELLDIQGRLHNTAFQRVDRCSAGHGVVAYLPFADPDVVKYARSIPPELLIKDGKQKWIVRRALEGKLPEDVLWRGKAKFWEGSGINELFEGVAANLITDADYEQEKALPNGWTIRNKEELLYYRAFKDYFGEMKTLEWMGRTKGA